MIRLTKPLVLGVLLGLVVSSVAPGSVWAAPESDFAQARHPLSYSDAFESKEKTLGPAQAVLKVVDPDGNPVEEATVTVVSYLDNTPQVIWTGKTDSDGLVKVDLNEDLSNRSEDLLDVHYSIRIFDDKNLLFGMTDISFVRVLNPAKFSASELQEYAHPELYARTVHLQKVGPEALVQRPDVSKQIVDVIVWTDYVNADVRMLDVPLAYGLKVTVTFGESRSYTNRLDVGYKIGDNNWTISGERSITSSIKASNYYTGGILNNWREYTIPVYGPWTFKIEKWAHWLDCEGCNFGYYYYIIRPDSYNGGVRFSIWEGTRSHNGETPSGRQGYIDPPGGIWQLEINSGFKWNVAFTIDLSQWYLPSFSGGHTQQYGGQKMAEYSVPNWKSYIKRYWFFDRDNSKKTWYVTIEEY